VESAERRNPPARLSATRFFASLSFDRITMPDCPIISFEIPNPFFEGRNRVYLIESEPLTLIDTGVATERAFDALVDALKQNGYAIRDVARVVLTHKHIDHIGNAWRIQRESSAEILIHESETHAVSDVDPDGGRFQELVSRRLAEWDVDETAWSPASVSNGPKWEIEPARPTAVVDGQRIDVGRGALEVIHTPGHTIGSICLKLGRRLFSGDHVLPDISPNIGGGDMRRRDMLTHYLRALERTASLADGVDEVLPGHGAPFSNLRQRRQELVDHHRSRLEKIVEILSRNGPQRVYGMARHLFGEMRDFHIVLGCAEAQAHLDFLVTEGRVANDHGLYRLT
jgi:hydroxyacylglutathione hydrolase